MIYKIIIIYYQTHNKFFKQKVFIDFFYLAITYLAGVVVDQVGRLLGVEQDIALTLTVIPYCCQFG